MQATLEGKLPGYAGYVPSSSHRIGDKPGYTQVLADAALCTAADYDASARKQYSQAIPMSSYHAQHGLAVNVNSYLSANNNVLKVTNDVKQKTEQANLDSREHHKNSSTLHWGTTYDASFGDAGKKLKQLPEEPSQKEERRKSVLSHVMPDSCYVKEFRDPYSENVIKHAPGKMPASSAADLSLGTNKNSKRILGYSGFVPASARNQNCMHEHIKTPKRELITSNMRLNVSGYTGHTPHCAQNDHGPRIASDLTTSGFFFSGKLA